MALDVVRDARRLRGWLLLAALVLVAVLAHTAGAGFRTEWVQIQDRFASAGQGDAAAPPGIVEVHACDGQTDRCMTCHREAQEEVTGVGMPPPLHNHIPPLDTHSPHRFGCATCHGGTPRALEADVAHALTGSPFADPLLNKPHVEASCVRCHLPGEVEGTERALRGANLLLRLGCAMCHSLEPGGLGGWDYGPDLRAVGRTSIQRLRRSIQDPTADFVGSTMPSYRKSFADDPDALVDLLIYVQSLALPDGRACDDLPSNSGLVRRRCATCHAGSRDGPAGRHEHRCAYIIERRAELECRRCHADHPPAAGPHAGFCPLVNQHREACAACHWGV